MRTKIERLHQKRNKVETSKSWSRLIKMLFKENECETNVATNWKWKVSSIGLRWKSFKTQVGLKFFD